MMLGKAVTLARKEVRSYFNSWMGILTLVLFTLIAGILFALPVFTYMRISMTSSEQILNQMEGVNFSRFVFNSFFSNLASVLVFLVPILSMRSFAEEKNRQTCELLFTYPLSDFDIVIGKYLGMVRFFLFLILPTVCYLCLLQWVQIPIDWGTVLMGYLGFWLLGCAYLALGLFMSTLCSNQIVSAMGTLGFILSLWLFEALSGLTTGPVSGVFKQLSPMEHYREFILGIFDLSHAVYFLFFILYFLFLALRSIETRNWQG